MAKAKLLDTKKHFHRKLVLNQWLVSSFGIDPLTEQRINGKLVRPLNVLSMKVQNANAGLSADRHHFYLQKLITERDDSWRYTEQELKTFDANLVAHLDEINLYREEKIQWKYFQWLSLMFVEIYLHEFFKDRHGLLNCLNDQYDNFVLHYKNQNMETGIQPFAYEDLNKLCLQNATGSGKTLLMHCNILQFKHYANQGAKHNDYSEIILISPNDRLSEQHSNELEESNIHNDRLVQGKDLISSGRTPLEVVSITEITKLGEKQGKDTMAVDSFGDQNLLLVDEGHRGLGAASTESGWLANRKKLAGNGFTFEYSATFKEAVVAAKNTQVESDYAKAVIFDYAYRYFYEDGYGKDYRIFNLPNDKNNNQHQNHYLTAALIAFYQQLKLFKDKKIQFDEFQLQNPLWVFVGASVVKDDGKTESATNYNERASDVAEALKYFGWFLANPSQSTKAIDTVLNSNASHASLIDDDGKDIFGSSFTYLKELKLSSSDVYNDICKLVFQSHGGGTLLVERIKGDSGELLLKVANENAKPFGLINVGDAKGLAKHLKTNLETDQENNIEVKPSEFSNPYFAQVNDENSPVNILIGSRKFVEGWNSWRVSSMGLMNTGKKEGSQIIQLFGRGVRLKGRDTSLMRSSRYQTALAPKHIHILETLNVFGIGSDFIESFRNFLSDEGLPGNESPCVETVKLNVAEGLGERLKMLRPKVRKDTLKTYSFSKDGPMINFGGKGSDLGLTKDITDKGRKIVLDRRPNLQAMLAPSLEDDGNVALASSPSTFVFDELRLSLLDLDSLYLNLCKYVQSRGYSNLLIQRDRLPSLLLSSNWYDLFLVKSMWDLNASNIKSLHFIALELLSMLADKIHNYRRREFLEPRLEVVTLDDSNSNIPGVNEYTIIVDANESALIDDIRQLKSAFEIDGTDDFDSGRETITGTNLDIHLFNPLLCSKSSKIKVQPVGLEPSEFAFVKDLKEWLKSNQSSLSDTGEELYLLRNQVKKGIGFFEAGNFYPDFILWRIWKEGKETKQRIVFIDPHGLQHEGAGSEKINFSGEIQKVQKRMDDEVELNSIILSPPKTMKSVISARWGLSEAELYNLNVFFMADGDEYLDQVMQVVRK